MGSIFVLLVISHTIVMIINEQWAEKGDSVEIMLELRLEWAPYCRLINGKQFDKDSVIGW